jgi:hypothetical protein
MKTDNQLPGRDAVESLGERPDASVFDGPVDSETIARSDTNILQWQEYLPEDCVRKMIEMKWDVTT